MAERAVQLAAFSSRANRTQSALVGGRILLALASLLLLTVLLLGSETVTRLVAPDYLIKARGTLVFSATYGWASRHRISTTLKGNRVTLNEAGYRGRFLDPPRTAYTRVVVLGDSIAFGLGVSDDETFSSRLDTRDNGIEVANLAVQGYGPDQELLVLQRDALHLRPDVVVLAFCMANDLAESMLPVSLYDGTTPKPRFRLVGEGLVLDATNLKRGPAWRAQRALVDHSHVFNRLTALMPPAKAAPGPHWRERHADVMQQAEWVIATNRALVQRMRALCLDHGIEFLVVTFPDRFSFRQKTPLLQRFVDALAADGIRVLDMAARFRSLNLRLRDVAIDGTGHLNPVGHAIVSEELEAAITAHMLARRLAALPPG